MTSRPIWSLMLLQHYIGYDDRPKNCRLEIVFADWISCLYSSWWLRQHSSQVSVYLCRAFEMGTEFLRFSFFGDVEREEEEHRQDRLPCFSYFDTIGREEISCDAGTNHERSKGSRCMKRERMCAQEAAAGQLCWVGWPLCVFSICYRRIESCDDEHSARGTKEGQRERYVRSLCVAKGVAAWSIVGCRAI